MKAETMLILTGKQYIEIKDKLLNSEFYDYDIGTHAKPEIVKISGIYLDTDADFTRNPKQFAKINDNMNVQVKIEYEE